MHCLVVTHILLISTFVQSQTTSYEPSSTLETTTPEISTSTSEVTTSESPSTTEITSESTSETTTETASQSTTETASQSTTEITSESTSESTTEFTSTTAIESTTESPTESTTDFSTTALETSTNIETSTEPPSSSSTEFTSSSSSSSTLSSSSVTTNFSTRSSRSTFSSRSSTQTTTTNGIQCQLFNINSTNELFFPQPTKQLFNQGEFVNVYCRFGRVHSNSKTSMQFNCTSNGEWDDTAETQPCLSPSDIQLLSTTTQPTSSSISSSTQRSSTTSNGIQCQLFNINSSTEMFFPQPTKQLFNQGESVNVYCLYGQVHSNGRTSMQFNCLTNGQWDGTADTQKCSLPTNAQAVPTTPAPSNVTCPQLDLDLTNTLTPKPEAAQISGPQQVGIKVPKVCNAGYVHEDSLSPINIYVCLANGQWSSNSQDSTCIDS
ncbi:Sushi domain-containing protein [Aphelenchoides besseyi]|nr:Sushi domain-containing protein [Aphelenchoides besseyi]